MDSLVTGLCALPWCEDAAMPNGDLCPSCEQEIAATLPEEEPKRVGGDVPRAETAPAMVVGTADSPSSSGSVYTTNRDPGLYGEEEI